MRRITDLIYKGKEYVVVDLEAGVGENKEYRYGTINRNLISNGRLTREINGLEMMLETSLEGAINGRKAAIDFRELLDAGMTYEEIALKMLGGNK